jgi:hypothetical protein
MANWVLFTVGIFLLRVGLILHRLHEPLHFVVNRVHPSTGSMNADIDPLDRAIVMSFP